MRRPPYKDSIGGVIQGLLNGLKQTPQTLAPRIGMDPRALEDVIAGKAAMSEDLERALVALTGINQRDFYPSEFSDRFPVIDDTDEGVRVMRALETRESARTISRGPDATPYYIYADTAMSNRSTFRPEWIQELFVHGGEDADLPDWAFNKGHFEHQVTYFIGPVNFYWIGKGGTRHVRQMQTGDSCYITPFVPHSFTTRKAGEGRILAVTYGGAIATVAFQAEIGSRSLEEYRAYVREKLASLPLSEDPHMVDGISILPHQEVLPLTKGGVQCIPLVQAAQQTHTRMSELVFPGSRAQSEEAAASDRWIYTMGTAPVLLRWGAEKTAEVAPGDSVYIAPGTRHTLQAEGGSDARLLVVDISPEVGSPYAELKQIEQYVGTTALGRVHTETTRWY